MPLSCSASYKNNDNHLKIIPPGQATLYSHARKDSVSSEKLVSNFLVSGENEVPERLLS